MGLRHYVIRRLILIIPVLIGVSLLVFAITMMFDPTTRASLYMTQPRRPEDIPRIIEKYGLNDPFYVQYFGWMSQVLSGNLGWSKIDRMPVSESLLQRLPATAELTLYSSPLIILIGIYLGVKSAVHKDKPIDHTTRTTSIIGTSLPSFWLAILLLTIFYVALGWFSPGRLSAEANVFVQSPAFIRYTRINTLDALLNGQPWIFWDALRHLVLPVTVLVTIQVATLIRVMRSSMLEELGKGYVTTARAKGLTEKEVINKHARKNALIPTITLSGLMVAGMLNGLIITETIFVFDGLGRFSAQAAIELDIPSVLGFTLLSALIFVLANLIMDILYAYIDPRIRLE